MMIDLTHHHTQCLQSMRQSRETIVETSFRHSSIVSLYYASAGQFTNWSNVSMDGNNHWSFNWQMIQMHLMQSYAFYSKEILWEVSQLSNIFGCTRSGLKCYNLAMKITLIHHQQHNTITSTRRSVLCYLRKSGFLYAQIIMIQIW